MLTDAQAFIKIRSGSFVDENCKEFFFSGYNTWQVIHLASPMCAVLSRYLVGGAEAYYFFQL